ncbi:uncharacterized protein LOC131945220 [Physella acuta]|uniref:uncharacterized protein LOC131945220 n=1 Tax=Physella acuta TaxID=109671 RepID=UPI0027DD65B9|nr:uncharacterized protein LOC131945220 [Physella acuta]
MTTFQELPSELVDEIWQVMNEIANDSFTVQKSEFSFECDGDEEENDSPESDKKQEFKKAANKLAKIGDQLTQEQDKKKEEDNLVQEIVAYLLDKSREIDEKLGPQLSSSLSFQSLFSNPFWSVIYGSYRSKMEGFIGSNSEVTEIALVSHVTKGIVRSTGMSSSLVASLSTQFIIEKCGGYLKKSGSLVKIASSAAE